DQANVFKASLYQITASNTAYSASLDRRVVSTFSFDYSGLTGLQVRTGGLRNILRVSNLFALPMTILDGNGQDNITVGNAQTGLDNISHVSVFGHAGTSLTLDNESGKAVVDSLPDSSTSFDVTTYGHNARFAVTESQVEFNDMVVVTDETVIRGQPPQDVLSSSQPFTAVVGYSGIGRLNIISASSTPPSGAGVLLDAGGSPSVFNVQGTAASTPVTISLGVGDTVNVGSTANSLDAIQGALTVNGRGVNNALNIHDEGTTAQQTYTVHADSVQRWNIADIG